MTYYIFTRSSKGESSLFHSFREHLGEIVIERSARLVACERRVSGDRPGRAKTPYT